MKAVIGIDYGTDSVRALVVNSENGHEIATQVHYYSRWKNRLYCDPVRNQWRQHPLDYIEGLENAVNGALSQAGPDVRKNIVGISVDTTGSTPVAVNNKGIPLSLLPGFESNPHAMFVLWKDHTAVQEADEINALCRKWHTDYTQYEGSIYSSEWFWAKILKISREDASIHQHAYSWVEHCDYIPFLLTGGDEVKTMRRSRCASGHKALWHPSWNGLPANDFLVTLDPGLDGLRERLYTDTYTSDQVAGHLSVEWAGRLGLSINVVISVGAFDAHMGAVGGQIKPYYLSKVMGTSTCDILVASNQAQEHLVKGICGQVDGSVIPGMLGLEAGQSGFGDIYAWFVRLLSYSVTPLIAHSELIDKSSKEKLIEESVDRLMIQLSKDAERVSPGATGILSLDWMNGRRTPDADQNLKGVISGLNLGSDAPQVFRSLVEATCYGARLIVDRFIEEGISIKGLIGLGGVAKKSPFIMQIMANVMNMPIHIARSEQTCALGAAMFAAVAAGIYSDVSVAMEKMGSGFDKEYSPQPEVARQYEALYQDYKKLCGTMENFQSHR